MQRSILYRNVLFFKLLSGIFVRSEILHADPVFPVGNSSGFRPRGYCVDCLNNILSFPLKYKRNPENSRDLSRKAGIIARLPRGAFIPKIKKAEPQEPHNILRFFFVFSSENRRQRECRQIIMSGRRRLREKPESPVSARPGIQRRIPPYCRGTHPMRRVRRSVRTGRLRNEPSTRRAQCL